jgi:regulatory protein
VDARTAVEDAGSSPASPAPAPTTSTSEGRDPVDAAFAFMVASTANRPQTEAELLAKLARRGVDEDVAAAAIRRAKEQGLVDDAAFARAWVEDRGRQRGFGAARLRQELRRRLVPEPLVEDALMLLEDRDDLAAATELARDRAAQLPASLPVEKAARRLQSYLMRRGYPAGLAHRAAITVSGLDREWD